MTTGAGSLNPDEDENEVPIPDVEIGAGLETTGTGVMVGVIAGAVMPVAGVETAGTGIGMGAEIARPEFRIFHRVKPPGGVGERL